MKNWLFIVSISFLILNCSKPTPINTDNKGTIEIKEKMFVGQVNDVYLNEKDYLGRTIKLEGMFMNEQWEDEDGSYSLFAVYRYGPGGCCGYDGIVGFEVRWPFGKEEYYPKNDSWVEATGIINKYDYEDIQVVYMDLVSLKVLEERGKEYVIQ